MWDSHVRAQLKKRKSNPKRVPGDCYSVAALGKAIGRACQSAEIKRWTPNQLRHSTATRIRKEYGLELAKVILGHSSVSMTEVYAEVYADWENR